MMPKNYIDFVEAMSQARAAGHDIDFLMLTEESISTFLTDGNFTEETEEKHDELGKFEVPIERGERDVLVTATGDEFDL